MVKYKIEGMDELEKTIKKLGQLPQKCVTTAAKKGATVALKYARANAPVDTGELRKGIILKGEKLKIRGKKVYQVTFDRNKNDIFVKMSKDGKKRYYYPASMEYGFIARNGKRVEGHHFLRDAIDKNKAAIEKTVVETLTKEIDKLK